MKYPSGLPPALSGRGRRYAPGEGAEPAEGKAQLPMNPELIPQKDPQTANEPLTAPSTEAVLQVFRGPDRGFELRNLPLPEPAAGEVLVQVRLATICGSDLYTVRDARPQPVPAVLGHEGVGTVAAAGRGRDLEVGTRVTWSLVDRCGSCAWCTRYGLPEKCESLFKYGHASLAEGGASGCYASHILLRPGTEVVAVPEGLSDTAAAPANCVLATAVNVVSQLPESCESAVVQGADLLGLYLCALLPQTRGRPPFLLRSRRPAVGPGPRFRRHPSSVRTPGAREAAVRDPLPARRRRRDRGRGRSGGRAGRGGPVAHRRMACSRRHGAPAQRPAADRGANYPQVPDPARGPQLQPSPPARSGCGFSRRLPASIRTSGSSHRHSIRCRGSKRPSPPRSRGSGTGSRCAPGEC